MADENSKPRLSRATAQPSRSGGDPLAELARLIGRDEVFLQMRTEAGRPKTASERAPWMARRDAREDLRGSQPGVEERPVEQPRRLATPQAPAASVPWRGSARPAPDASPRDERDYAEPAATAAAYEEPAQTADYDTFEDRRATDAAPAYESYETQDYYDDQETYADEQPLAPRRRKGVWAVAAMLAVAVVGTAGALGYKSLSGGGADKQVPIIKADTAPAKLVPPAPTRDPQTRTASLDGARGVGERLVSNEEQPVDLDAKLAAARANAAAATTGAISPTGSSPSMMSLASAPPTAAPSGDAGGPKKVRTISIRPDGTPVAPVANSAPRATTASDPGTRLPGDMAGRPASRPNAPQQIAPAADPARPTRSASLGPTPQQAAPAAPAGGPMVQLASQKSEADAHAAYRALQAKYPNILSGRQATIKRVEIADKGTFFRAQVGPFGSSDQASEFCNSLKAVGGQCIVQRN